MGPTVVQAPPVVYQAPAVERRVQIQHVERVVEVPQVQVVQRHVHVPGPVETREIVRHVPKLITEEQIIEIHIPQVQHVEKVIELPQVQTMQRHVHVPGPVETRE